MAFLAIIINIKKPRSSERGLATLYGYPIYSASMAETGQLSTAS